MPPLHLAWMAGAELGALVHGLGDRLAYHRVAMAEQQRTVAAEVVDVAVTIDIPFVRTLGALDIDAVRIDVAGVVRDAAGEQFAGFLRQIG